MFNYRIVSPKSFLKTAGKIAGIVIIKSLVSGSSCCTDPPTPPPPEDNPPETAITREFTPDGLAELTVSGTDPDGDAIERVDVKLNNTGDYWSYDNNSKILVPVAIGDNSAEAIAYAKGLADPTPAIDFFTCPTDEQAKTSVGDSLSQRSNTYNSLKPNYSMTLGESEPSFIVDYLIKKYDGTDAVVNYNHEGLEKELLDSYGIPNINLPRLPDDERNVRLNAFIDGGYN